MSLGTVSLRFCWRVCRRTNSLEAAQWDGWWDGIRVLRQRCIAFSIVLIVYLMIIDAHELLCLIQEREVARRFHPWLRFAEIVVGIGRDRTLGFRNASEQYQQE